MNTISYRNTFSLQDPESLLGTFDPSINDDSTVGPWLTVSYAKPTAFMTEEERLRFFEDKAIQEAERNQAQAELNADPLRAYYEETKAEQARVAYRLFHSPDGRKYLTQKACLKDVQRNWRHDRMPTIIVKDEEKEGTQTGTRNQTGQRQGRVEASAESGAFGTLAPFEPEFVQAVIAARLKYGHTQQEMGVQLNMLANDIGRFERGEMLSATEIRNKLVTYMDRAPK